MTVIQRKEQERDCNECIERTSVGNTTAQGTNVIHGASWNNTNNAKMYEHNERGLVGRSM